MRTINVNGVVAWRRVVTILRVGGFLIAGAGVAFLNTGFGIDFAHLDRPTRAACALIGIGVMAEVVSFALPRGRTKQNNEG